jgi:hypothetical protein
MQGNISLADSAKAEKRRKYGRQAGLDEAVIA